MNTENIPQVGSKWQVGNEPAPEVVVSVRKLGRGYQVETESHTDSISIGNKRRLADFRRLAKPL